MLVVDDGSEDRTAAEAELAGARVIRHAAIRGVGGAFHSALNYGLEHGADLIVSLDADGQFNPADIPALIAPVVAGEAEFTTASRFKDPTLTPEMTWSRLWGNRMMSRIISSLTRQRFYDVSCGMRCYGRRAALQLYLLARFTYTQEVFLNLAFREVRIIEVPIRVRGVREFGQSRVAGSLPRYALRTATIIIRSYRDYWPLQFFGVIALALLAARDGFGGFFLFHYLRTRSVPPAHLGGGRGRRLRRPGGVGDPHRSDRRHAQSPPHLPRGVALPAAQRRSGDADAPRGFGSRLSQGSAAERQAAPTC